MIYGAELPRQGNSSQQRFCSEVTTVQIHDRFGIGLSVP
jgi:hypothetical protein